MDKAHNVEEAKVSGTMLSLRVDGRTYEIDLAKESGRLANATQQQREHFEVSPAGYGIHWPDVDEDISVEALVAGRASRESQASLAKWLASRGI